MRLAYLKCFTTASTEEKEALLCILTTVQFMDLGMEI
jgi:hypothetical protein